MFDAEDYGPHEITVEKAEDAWCLGSQYWQKIYVQSYNAMWELCWIWWEIANATFYKEYFSMYYAATIVNKVWIMAQEKTWL